MILKDGSEVQDPRLDRLIEFDEASRGYPITMYVPSVEVELRPKRWSGGVILDQGEEGACVGFSWATEMSRRPLGLRGVDEQLAMAIYCRAQLLDPWPGGSRACGHEASREGTSVLAGAKAAQEFGYVVEYRWAFDIDQVISTLINFGPCCIGINWYSDMYRTRPSGLVEVGGSLVGGHQITLTEYHPARRMRGEDWHKRYEVIGWDNTWGLGYGLAGRGYIEVDKLEALLKDRGEVCIPVTRKRVPTFPPKPRPGPGEDIEL